MLLRKSLVALAILSTLAACGKGPRKEGNASAASGPGVALVTAEDILTVSNSALASGPLITGSVQPGRRADLRAEVAAVVLQVFKENGEAVKKGDLLVRLDDTSIRDSVTSAVESERSSARALEQAERTFQRLKTLRASGMASLQQLDDSEVRRNSAHSENVAAKAREAQARQQLQRTEARAPFDGIVSDRKVSPGDTAMVSKELLKVVDPASMRFEGLVSADQVGRVQVGQPVRFSVAGYPGKEFGGKVKRVNPGANITTRQVEVMVEFNPGTGPLVSGLYAEGRIEAASSMALTLPESALVRDGDKVYAWRIKGNALQKVALSLGERDPRRGNVVVTSGLASGDAVLRSPGMTLKDGQKVERKATPKSLLSEMASAPAPGAASAPVSEPAPVATPASASASVPAPASAPASASASASAMGK